MLVAKAQNLSPKPANHEEKIMSAEQKIVVDEATLATAKKLRGAGFVHVTGLRAYCSGRDSYRIQARRQDLGRSGYNNGKYSIITSDGEVWLGATTFPQEDDLDECSNGEQLCTHSLLRRIANSYDDVGCDYSPIPQIEG